MNHEHDAECERWPWMDGKFICGCAERAYRQVAGGMAMEIAVLRADLRACEERNLWNVERAAGWQVAEEAAVSERDALRASLVRLERQVNASVTKEVYAAQAETVTQLRADLDSAREEITLRQAAFVVLRADLRACAEALETIYDFEKSLPLREQNAGVLEVAYAALARPGVRDALK